MQHNTAPPPVAPLRGTVICVFIWNAWRLLTVQRRLFSRESVIFCIRQASSRHIYCTASTAACNHRCTSVYSTLFNQVFPSASAESYRFAHVWKINRLSWGRFSAFLFTSTCQIIAHEQYLHPLAGRTSKCQYLQEFASKNVWLFKSSMWNQWLVLCFMLNIAAGALGCKHSNVNIACPLPYRSVYPLPTECRCCFNDVAEAKQTSVCFNIHPITCSRWESFCIFVFPACRRVLA